ncbi:hypothetical protein [Cytophaga hutchinsonii]|jgi:hypothetical protein|uniref:Uncharacterized protein n=1 Tax=Cytophaga hutchinsonii (strain ATCC 33406 / DSM 1761 / CIP 103989 / NBRC 15051 / NCIMB 9469 / D465) TaxID=269798 RepID=A0A6N4SQF1_CYTH3|nr:hypothetical protein [Cytophaga hutchinsonii]ABG58513.1 hypothetical protein CHU_1241 [Cytophaga hutchinsonii ATCC 33406]SFX76032.1 hypothetical protein SAMN04487930_10981 [Cytophaga hutchinsonii ATCC 33406]
MNRFILSILAVFMTHILVAQSADSLMNEIQIKARAINQQRTSYDSVVIRSWEKTPEGVSVVGYMEKKDIRLIFVTWTIETGKKEMYYYFFQGKLIYAFQRNYAYNRPISWDQNKALQNGDKEYYDPLKTKISRTQYYFSREKLFKTMDADQGEIMATPEMNQLTGKGLITDAYKWKRELIK